MDCPPVGPLEADACRWCGFPAAAKTIPTHRGEPVETRWGPYGSTCWEDRVRVLGAGPPTPTPRWVSATQFVAAQRLNRRVSLPG